MLMNEKYEFVNLNFNDLRTVLNLAFDLKDMPQPTFGDKILPEKHEKKKKK